MKRLGLALLLLFASTAHAKPEMPKPVPVGVGGATYRVACKPCKKHSSCLVVSAGEGKRVKTKLVLSDEDGGCADSEADSSEFTAVPVKLDGPLNGVLVRQDSGGEAIGVRYVLVGLIDGKLRSLWEAFFGGQEVFSADQVQLRLGDVDKNGREELDYRASRPWSSDEGSIAAGGGTGDSWEHEHLEFDPATKKMATRPFVEYASVVSTFETEPEALRYKVALAKKSSCTLDDLLILATSDFPKPPAGAYMLAGFFDTEQDARARLAELKRCAPSLVGSVSQVR